MNERSRTDLMPFGFPSMGRMFGSIVSALPQSIM
jgi:hypothetical protein